MRYKRWHLQTACPINNASTPFSFFLFFLTRGELKLSSIAVPSFRAERQRSAPLFAALLFSQWLIPTREKTGRPRINISSSQKREAHPDNTPTAALSLSLSRSLSFSSSHAASFKDVSLCFWRFSFEDFPFLLAVSRNPYRPPSLRKK